MKKINKYWIIFSVIIFIFLLLGIRMLILFWNIPWTSRYGTYVHYGEREFSSNEKYNGIIDTQQERVSILDQSQKEVSGIDIKECYPQQIVLGENSYFLLFQEDIERGDARIVQYDYQSVKQQEYMALNTAVIAYKDGYLFTGNWKGTGENKDYFTYNDYVFYANNYIKEEDFGEQLEPLKQDLSGKCMIGNTELYYHEDGYFLAEPPLNDYSELLLGDFRTSDNFCEAATRHGIKNIEKHRSLILSEIGNVDGVYDVFAYQIENNIYGLCNVFEEGKYIPSLPTEAEDVKSTYFYKINPEENEITILLKKDSCIGLVLSENEAVYQENNRIMHHDFEEGDEKEIYQINNEHNVGLYIKRDSLMVIEEKKRALPFTFPTNESVKSIIKRKYSF